MIRVKHKQAFITHCDEAYAPIVDKMIETVKEFSSIPIIAYIINSDKKLKNADLTIRLDAPVRDGNQFIQGDGNPYINRGSSKVYDIISRKPHIIKHALENHAESVVYLDGDSIATPRIDDLFNWTHEKYPMLTRGCYDFMLLNGRGYPYYDENGESKVDFNRTIEAPLCQLLSIDQSIRKNKFTYVQSGYISATQSNIEFINEWAETCDMPEIRNNSRKYAPFHEESIINALFWKYGFSESMPLIYVNANDRQRIKDVYSVNIDPNKPRNEIKEWFVMPSTIEDVKVFHGEKRPDVVDQILDEIKIQNKQTSKKRLLYIAPHLSTGGMPQFLLKRVETLINEEEIEIHVVEFSNYSDDFVVQKNELKKLLGNRLYLESQGRSIEQREQRLLQLIDSIKPNIIHIEECPESFDSGNKMSLNTLNKIYRPDRPYQIVETCHNIWMGNDRKTWHPNSYMYCTPYHPLHNFSGTPSAGSVVEYPIEDLANTLDVKQSIQSELGMPADKINVLNVGLWTQGKNQGEGIEIARIAEDRYPGKFQFHFVGNQAGNFQDYWEPIMKEVPSNVTVWGERNDTDQFYQVADAFMFNSTWECNPLSLREAISHRLPTFTRNLPQYLDMFTPYIVPFSDNLEENADILLRELIESGKNFGDFIPPTNDVERFRTEMLAHYSETHTAPEVTLEVKAHVTYERYFKLHVGQLPPSPHRARFIDTTTNHVIYETAIEEGHWYQPNQHWFTPWRVEILRGDLVVWSETVTTQGGEVAVQFDSNSLGDSLAWMGQLEQFKNYWGFKRVWVRTHKNWLWDTDYYASRGIQITSQLPGGVPKVVLGVFYEMSEPWKRTEHRMDWRKIHLAQIASDRLGIPAEDFRVERPKLGAQFQKTPMRKVGKPIATFATHSTAGAKYWQRDGCWEELMNGMPEYHWVHTSREGHRPPAQQSGESLEEVASWINSSKFFVGISSGLSWFAWALGVPTYVISGFTPDVVEECDGIEVIKNTRVCNGCWAWDVFDRGDWNWCPAHKGTGRQFECSRDITPQHVINIINKN